MQTTDQTGRERPAASGGVTHVPPPMPPQLFTCPERQQVVPGVRPPEARSDLVDLMRVVNDHIGAAMGVPASVIFEGTHDPLNHRWRCSSSRVCLLHREILEQQHEPTPVIEHDRVQYRPQRQQGAHGLVRLL